MSTSPGINQPAKTGQNYSALFQLIASTLAALLLLGAAGLIALISAVQFFSSSGSATGSGNVDPTQSFMIAASLAFTGVLLLPSAWYSWKHITHPGFEPVSRPERKSFGLILTIVVLVLVAGSLFLGDWASKDDRVSWVFLPFLNLLATGLPALWLVYIGTHGLLPTAPKRKWGVFATGLVLGPFIILILEILVFIAVGFLAILSIMIDPKLSSQLNSLANRLQVVSPNIDAMLNTLLPYLLNPGVLFLGFVFVSVLVPLIEETLKPIGVWFLAGQKITPAMGFGYGVISGAGFGLFENLGNTSGGGDTWALIAAARITTLLLHCFTAGLVGWALASAWSQRRYLRLAVSFIAAILIHGLWNGMSIMSAVSSLQGVANISIPASLKRLSGITTVGVVVLGVLVLVLFIGFNAMLRRSTLAATPLSSGNDLPGTYPIDVYQSDLPGEGLPTPANEPNHLVPGENPPANSENNS
jgi:RsiW-degrading membrane proteinase PrsW (M82 family)